jgi:hypothetical protein
VPIAHFSARPHSESHRPLPIPRTSTPSPGALLVLHARTLSHTAMVTATPLALTQNGWSERLSMKCRRGRTDVHDEWWVVLNLPPGEYTYKFVVQAPGDFIDWCVSPDMPTMVDELGVVNNCVVVADQEHYESGVTLEPPAEPDDDEGYSDQIPSELYFEMLCAQEPPSAPVHLCVLPPAAAATAQYSFQDVEGRTAAALPPPLPPPLLPPPLLPPTPPARNELEPAVPSAPSTPSTPSTFATPPERRSPSMTAMFESQMIHSSLLHACVPLKSRMGDSSGAEIGDATADTPTPSVDARTRCDDMSDASNDGLSPLPPPTVARTTFRHRTKFVTVEYIRAAKATRG